MNQSKEKLKKQQLKEREASIKLMGKNAKLQNDKKKWCEMKAKINEINEQSSSLEFIISSQEKQLNNHKENLTKVVKLSFESIKENLKKFETETVKSLKEEANRWRVTGSGKSPEFKIFQEMKLHLLITFIGDTLQNQSYDCIVERSWQGFKMIIEKYYENLLRNELKPMHFKIKHWLLMLKLH